MSPVPPPATSELSHRGHRLLGRYELIGELARGGMGTVYLARNAGEGRFQRLFAIKVLHPHLAAETAFIDMMRDEAHIAARLHHPNVVPILDLGTEGDLHYVVMEYIEGPALSTLLKRTGERRPADLIVAILIDALEGLHAAHSLQDDEAKEVGLVHRDVSPPNILVGSDGIGRITDFGVAKAEERISSTRPGMRKGKLQYMSPEQIKDGDAVDHRTDIWAIATVLWNALTGENLFRGESDGATIHNIIQKEIPLPSTVGHKPPSCFDAILLRALSRSPADRYATALEMADALRVTAAGNGLAASKHQVARWISDLFGNELDQRRRAIREASQRRAESHDTPDSRVNILQAPASGLVPFSTNGITTLTRLSHIPSFSIEPTTPGHATLGSGLGSASATGSATASNAAAPLPEIQIDASEFQDKKKRPWVVMGLIAAALLVLYFALRSEGEPQVADRAGPATSAAPIATSAAETAPTEQKAAHASPQLDADPTHARAGEEKKEPRGPAATKRAPTHPAPGQEAETPAAAAPTRAPKAEPKEPAAPSPRPTPSPASTDEFEKNPYLRR